MPGRLPDRLIIGITGASGVIYGVRLLEVLKDIENGEQQAKDLYESVIRFYQVFFSKHVSLISL